MLSKTWACGLEGVNGFPVQVETFVSGGFVGFEIVGLPGAAVKESRDRIRAAIAVNGYQFPFGKVTVNLAPADTRKEGTGFDLAIAMSVLSAAHPETFKDLEHTMLLGELSLQGQLMPVRGALGIAITAAENGFTSLILPKENALECACLENISVYPAQSLAEVYNHLSGKSLLTQQPHTSYDDLVSTTESGGDLKFVKGQKLARKALEVAAAGGHNILLVGIPGSGKTMLARCLPGILPPLSYEESLETTLIHSASGYLPANSGLITQRPFRSPHHSISMPAMIGGGNKAMPGEISLAHNGVLFLDELPEFQRSTLESLRQPLEDHAVCINRVGGVHNYMCKAMLVVGMNLCTTDLIPCAC